MDQKNLSSNWKKLQATLKSDKPSKSRVSSDHHFQQNGLKRKRPTTSDTLPISKRTKGYNTVSDSKRGRRNMSREGQGTVQSKDSAAEASPSDGSDKTGADSRIPGDRINEGLCQTIEIGKYIAIDCEMVGVGPNPSRESALARVSIVNYNGDQIYDSYVKPQEVVTDWRTHVSGIAPKHMIHARSLEEVQVAVASILKDRIVIGHSIRSDFDALLLSHPKKDIRDTARHPPFRKLAGGGSPKLKILASELLGIDIQTGEHSSVEDARATMFLFRKDKEAFEREHSKRWPVRIVVVKEQTEAVDDESGKRRPKKKKKKKR